MANLTIRCSLLAALFGALLCASQTRAQCPAVSSVSPPFTVPATAGAWSLQITGRPLAPGQFEYALIGLPMVTPLPMAALGNVLCNVVGNTPCWYVDFPAVPWFNFGPQPAGNGTTLTLQWPNQPWVVGIMFVAQFGIGGCSGLGPDESVVITGVIG